MLDAVLELLALATAGGDSAWVQARQQEGPAPSLEAALSRGCGLQSWRQQQQAEADEWGSYGEREGLD